MFFKKLIGLHILPACVALFTTLFFIRTKQIGDELPNYLFSAQAINKIQSIAHFDIHNLENQVAFSIALKRSVPVLFGSSELTTNHLEGLAGNFFNKHPTKDKFFSLGHAGFQSFAILTTLAANRAILKKSKITIILSPGWFEEHYSVGTSLESFFEFCPPNYLYQIYSDTTIDVETKKYIHNYLYRHYDKISKPNAVIRRMSRDEISAINLVANYPFNKLAEYEINQQIKYDFYLVSQKLIIQKLQASSITPYEFRNQLINWDSLETNSVSRFASISNNNNLCVENEYYNTWVKSNPEKYLRAVNKNKNREYQDFEALIKFLVKENIKPLFIIIPLNNKVYKNVEVLNPIISDLNKVLQQHQFKTLDMFTPNVIQYEPSVLEDIMHPYNTGWYQIDKFILDNYHD